MTPDIRAGATDLEIKDPDAPPKTPLRHREWGAATLGLMAGVAGLIAARLGHLWPSFDVFAQFGAQFLILTGAFVIAVAMPRFKAFIGLVLVVCGLVAYGTWPHIVSSGQPAQRALAAGERALTVAHYNTFVVNRDFAAQAAEIARLDADIVTLIEFDKGKVPMLQTLRAQYPFTFECTAVPACQMAVLSKFPIASVASNPVRDGPPAMIVKFDGALAGLTVISVHFTRFPHSRWQLRQAIALAGKLETLNGNIILMGDFNATPFSRVLSTVSTSTGMTRQTSLPTWPSDLGLPQLAIDHIFTSAGIRPLSAERIGNNAGSDHYPVVMTLALPPP